MTSDGFLPSLNMTLNKERLPSTGQNNHRPNGFHGEIGTLAHRLIGEWNRGEIPKQNGTYVKRMPDQILIWQVWSIVIDAGHPRRWDGYYVPYPFETALAAASCCCFFSSMEIMCLVICSSRVAKSSCCC